MDTQSAEPTTAQPHAPGPSSASTTVSRVRWWIHLTLISAYLLLLAVMGWSRGPSQAPVLSNRSGQLLVVCAVELAVFGFVFGLAWLASRASRDDLLLRWRGKGWPVPLGLAYSVALRLLLAIVVVTVSAVLVVMRLATIESIGRLAAAHPPNVEALVDLSAMRSDSLYYWLTLTVVSFIVAGLREELWRAGFLAGLRALWPRRFGSNLGQIGGVAIAAVVFGVAHVASGPMAMCLAGVLGLGLGVIMVLHRSIWPAVLAHGAFDATSLALIPWAMELLQRARQL
jgi:membrane protease YdiL (CAAX protease family)